MMLAQEMTFIGCPNCGSEPLVIRETPQGCLMKCSKCVWFGYFRECWKLAAAARAAAAASEERYRNP